MMQPSLLPTLSLTVSDLTRHLRQLMESDDLLRDVWVQGEISNLSKPSSGHIYFTLKDAGASLRGVIWRTSAARLRMNLQNGMAVEAHGFVSLYERDGAYQLYVDAVRLAGEGFLYQEFLRLKARLEAEGLFDEEHKRPLPERPRCIGIVTSPTGAALQDILNTLGTRYPIAEVVIAPVAVQGDSAPDEIAAAIKALNRLVRPDVIIVGRGGGSLEDLWAFNDEQVVRAVAGSAAPVISGIGHETDFTLTDFAADKRAPTPTGAAVIATPHIDDLRGELSAYADRLETLTRSYVEATQWNLDSLTQRLRGVSPEWRVQNDLQRLDELADRNVRAVSQFLRLHQTSLDGKYQRVRSLNPLSVLQRGFAVVTKEDGTIIHKADQVQDGEIIRARLLDGHITAKVNKITLIT